MPRFISILLLAAAVVFRPASLAASVSNSLDDPAFFPIAVWVQSPAHAQKYREAGINTYVGLWHGLTPEHLESLQKAGIKIVCAQNSFALRQTGNSSIIAWMHGDEPDNAQTLGSGKGYGPPILPEVIARNYQEMKKADPSRPVLLNFGQGVAWDNYIGRGVRRNHPEDYPEYLKGCDIASFDIYPAVHEDKEVAGKLEFVARGVQRLGEWSGGKKRVWNCIECTRISNVKTKPTPEQVRAEVWMSLIHGSRGLIYFVHQFKPEFREAALLDDPEMLETVTALNKQIIGLAPVLNSRSLDGLIEVKSAPESAPVAAMVKRSGNDLYVFAVGMRGSPTRATFTLKPNAESSGLTQVFTEKGPIKLADGKWSDDFSAYGFHIYVLRVAAKRS
ncbi:MAG TPA: hypothetical protein VK633_09520 [Verrucomicrobiae bacterium]|nr:hypothetical protein [Verrucomicrobiae bacterium]